MKIPFISFGTHDQIAAFKAAGQEIYHAGVTAGDHVVATIAGSPIGGKIIDAIDAIKDKSMTGVEKLEHVAVEDALPLIEEFATGGSVELVNSAKDTAFAVVTKLYNDLASGAVKAAGDVQAAAQAENPGGTTSTELEPEQKPVAE